MSVPSFDRLPKHLDARAATSGHAIEHGVHRRVGDQTLTARGMQDALDVVRRAIYRRELERDPFGTTDLDSIDEVNVASIEACALVDDEPISSRTTPARA